MENPAQFCVENNNLLTPTASEHLEFKGCVSTIEQAILSMGISFIDFYLSVSEYTLLNVSEYDLGASMVRTTFKPSCTPTFFYVFHTSMTEQIECRLHWPTIYCDEPRKWLAHIENEEHSSSYRYRAEEHERVYCGVAG